MNPFESPEWKAAMKNFEDGLTERIAQTLVKSMKEKMNTCKTCKHFSPRYEIFSGNGIMMGQCKNNIVDSEVRVGGYDEEGVEFHQDFGCIHHESRSETP